MSNTMTKAKRVSVGMTVLFDAIGTGDYEIGKIVAMDDTHRTIRDSKGDVKLAKSVELFIPSDSERKTFDRTMNPQKSARMPKPRTTLTTLTTQNEETTMNDEATQTEADATDATGQIPATESRVDPDGIVNETFDPSMLTADAEPNADGEEVTSPRLTFDLARYVRGTGTTAAGNPTIDNGDAVAKELAEVAAMGLEAQYAHVSAKLGVPADDLKARYALRNPGMQRMNLGNLLRGHYAKLKRDEEGAPDAEIRAKIKADKDAAAAARKKAIAEKAEAAAKLKQEKADAAKAKAEAAAKLKQEKAEAAAKLKQEKADAAKAAKAAKADAPTVEAA